MQTTYETVPALKSIARSVKTLPQWAVMPHSRVLMTVWLASADLMALFISGSLAILLRSWLGAGFSVENYYSLAPLLLFFMIGYMLVRLYPGVGVSPIEELRQLTYVSSIIMISLTVLLFLTQSGLSYSRLIFLLVWLFILVTVPVFRIIARKLGVIFHIWGEPVALIGFGPQGKHIYQYLKNNPAYGICPVVVVNGVENEAGDGQSEALEIPEISVTDLAMDHLLLARTGIKTAILAPSEIPPALRNSLVDEQQFGLERLILISSLNWIGGSAVVPHDLGGLLGLEVERNLLHAREQLVKRILDISIMLFVCLFGFPLLILCAILVRLDSPGPVFFRQRRVGKSGKAIQIWKFRTMVSNAEVILEKYLSKTPELRAEWEGTHKLKRDPRITRVGRFLRKTSLDELPQFLSVLKGEMSVVGPRPIVQDEIKFYKDGFKLYTQVLPGVSGLWQVSGRSETSYEYRVALDEYYIRHWSIWMDIYIMVRTIWVVLKHSGAC
jgi:Undecaprenyl-phosphate galactose phosphotransferase WbaP